MCTHRSHTQSKETQKDHMVDLKQHTALQNEGPEASEDYDNKQTMGG